MSEVKGSPEAAHVAAVVAEAIQEDWQEFEGLAARPALQELGVYHSRYHDVYSKGPLATFSFEAEKREFDADEIADMLNAMHGRQDVFIQAIIRGYCELKKLPQPEATDTEAVGEILAHVFSGGLDKITKYFNYSSRYEADGQYLYNQDQVNHLSSTLLMLGARLSSFPHYEVSEDNMEPVLPQAEIDALIDDRLQEACQRIQNNQKIPIPKGASDADRVFGGAMNCLRTLYFYGGEQGFNRLIYKMYLPLFKTDHIKRGDYPTYNAFVQATHKEKFRRLGEMFNNQIGSNFAYPGPQKAERMLDVAEAYCDETKSNDEKLVSDLYYITNMALSINATRHFVNAIADGRLNYSEIMQAMMQLRKRPLTVREAPEVIIPDVGLDWEVLPWELIMRGESDRPPMPDLDINKPEHPRQLDWGRIIRLRDYIIDWKDPKAYIARTVPSKETPGLSLRPDQQYYVAVLPQTLPDGTVIEHAIADHPELGNGIYMWRAETSHIKSIVGRNKDLTWREVLCHPKAIARGLGARRLNHSKHVEFNVLDYLTCPPEKIPTRRYAVGKGAMRMARLAQGGFQLPDAA